MIFNIKYKAQLCLIVLFLLLIEYSQAQNKITFVDCKTNNPIEGLVIYSGSGLFFGLTDSLGVCEITQNTETLQICFLYYEKVSFNSEIFLFP